MDCLILLIDHPAGSIKITSYKDRTNKKLNILIHVRAIKTYSILNYQRTDFLVNTKDVLARMLFLRQVIQ